MTQVELSKAQLETLLECSREIRALCSRLVSAPQIANNPELFVNYKDFVDLAMTLTEAIEEPITKLIHIPIPSVERTCALLDLAAFHVANAYYEFCLDLRHDEEFLERVSSEPSRPSTREIFVRELVNAQRLTCDKLDFCASQLSILAKRGGNLETQAPLTPKQEQVHRIIVGRSKEGKAIMGAEVIAELDLRSDERPSNFDESRLTKEIIPELKKRHGLMNKRGVGYFYPQHFKPSP